MAEPHGSSEPNDASEPLTWVERTVTVDAVDPAKPAIEDNPGWRLLHVGTGLGGQTTLTFGWPWQGAECGCYTVCERPNACPKTVDFDLGGR